MFKLKTLGTIALSIFAITFLYQVFTKAFTSQGGEFNKYAEESEANVKRLEEAFAKSRAATESLSTDNSASEVKPSKPSSFRFPQSGCGDKPTGGNDTWYPVFIDGADLDTVRANYCADAVPTKRKDTGVDTVQLASFTNRDKAVEFAQAVSGEVGEPTAPQAKSSNEPDQQIGVQVSPSEPTISEVESQRQQAELQQRQAEQATIEAQNLCRQKWIEAQKEVNKLRKATLGHEDNYITDFLASTAKDSEQLAKIELEECLLEVQSQQFSTTPE